MRIERSASTIVPPSLPEAAPPRPTAPAAARRASDAATGFGARLFAEGTNRTSTVDLTVPPHAPVEAAAFLEPLIPGAVALIGPLCKLGGRSFGLSVFKKHVDRFFVLDPPELRYYVTLQEARASLSCPYDPPPKGRFVLDRAVFHVSTDEATGQPFVVLELADGRTERLEPPRRADAAGWPSFDEWVRRIGAVVDMLARNPLY